MKNKIPSITIGLDLGDKKHALCVINAAGEIIDERSITNHLESLRRLSKKYPKARIAFEVGTHSPWINRFLRSCGHEVIVANTRKLRAISANQRKSDKTDARILARLARVDPELLYPIEHGSEEAQKDLLQIKLRDNLVRQRVNIISSVRFTVKSLGILLPSPGSACFAKRARSILTESHPEILQIVEPSLEVIDCLSASIRKFDKQIDELGETKYPATKILRQIPGIGPVTALSFVLVIEDPERFARNRDVGAYLGLVPRRDQSGDLDKQLRISKAGDAYLRKLLVGSAQYLLGHFGPDCDLKRKGLEMAARGGPRSKKKAVVAMARKLAVLMLVLWKTNGTYNPDHQQSSAA